MFSLRAVDVGQDMLLDHPLPAAVIFHSLHDHGALIRAELVVVESQLRGEGERENESVWGLLRGG